MWNEEPLTIHKVNSDKLPPPGTLLLGLVMIVKDAKKHIVSTLKGIKPYIDRWYILDTGSTDGTQKLIRKTLKGVEGCLYEEPFVDFATSRNRVLDLAGTECKYVIMLDDSYVLKHGGHNLRRVLYNSSYDLIAVRISTDEVAHIKGIVIRTECKLRYEYRVHEAILHGYVTLDPSIIEFTEIRDRDRTSKRLETDIAWLEEDYEKYKTPRFLFYLGQSCENLKWLDEALYWYKKRLEIQDNDHLEKYFSLNRIADILRERKRDECVTYYGKAIRIFPKQKESYYNLSAYLMQTNPMIAYALLKAGLHMENDQYFGLELELLNKLGLPTLQIQLSYLFWDKIDITLFDIDSMNTQIKNNPNNRTYKQALIKLKPIYEYLNQETS